MSRPHTEHKLTNNELHLLCRRIDQRSWGSLALSVSPTRVGTKLVRKAPEEGEDDAESEAGTI